MISRFFLERGGSGQGEMGKPDKALETLGASGGQKPSQGVKEAMDGSAQKAEVVEKRRCHPAAVLHSRWSSGCCPTYIN